MNPTLSAQLKQTLFDWESVAGSVIQATKKVEFEDCLWIATRGILDTQIPPGAN